MSLLNGLLDLLLQILGQLIVAVEGGNVECAIARGELFADVDELLRGYAAPRFWSVSPIQGREAKEDGVG